MTTAKAPGEFDALARDRYLTITVGVQHFDGAPDISEVWGRWDRATREILARMIHGAESEEEYNDLGVGEDAVRVALEEAATELVGIVERKRRAEKAAVA